MAINDLSPAKCTGYSNVVITCGTNDLRSSNPDITGLSDALFLKVRQIRLVNQHAKILVMPVLPTRDYDMNRNIMRFNCRVFQLTKCLRDSMVTMPCLLDFLDSTGRLAVKFTRRDAPNDGIHLGPLGISQYVRIIKNTIFNFDRNVRVQQGTRSRSGNTGSRQVKPV